MYRCYKNYSEGSQKEILLFSLASSFIDLLHSASAKSALLIKFKYHIFERLNVYLTGKYVEK